MAFTVVNGPTIAANQSLSSALDITAPNLVLVRIRFPTGWDSNWVLTFQSSTDNITYYDLYEPNGTELAIQVAPGGAVILQRQIYRSAYFKFRSGTALRPVNQSAARTFSCVLDTPV